MRQLFLLLALLPFASFAQSKGDTKIIATPTDTTHLFSKLITLLYTENYIIKVEDSTRGIIITEPKTIPVFTKAQVRLKLTIINNTVTVTGDLDPNLEMGSGLFRTKTAFEPIQFRGAKKSIYREAWDEMGRVAKIIGATSYGK